MIVRGASFTKDGMRRLELKRAWDIDRPMACVIGLNPSTADGKEDDPTIRRIIGLLDAAEYGGFIIVNLFSVVATDPEDCRKICVKAEWADIVYDNASLVAACKAVKIVIPAWGAGANRSWVKTRAEQVTYALKDGMGKPKVLCWGRTKHGHPRHPLFLKKDAALEPFFEL